jgi:cell division protein FtsB
MSAPASPGAPRFTAEQVRRRRAVALRVSVATIVVIGLLFVVVFPVQAWMRQRDDLHASQHRLEVIRRERVRLQREAKRLQDPREVERIAR